MHETLGLSHPHEAIPLLLGEEVVNLHHLFRQGLNLSGDQGQQAQGAQLVAGAVLPAAVLQGIVEGQGPVALLLGAPLPQGQHVAEGLGELPRAKGAVLEPIVAGLRLGNEFLHRRGERASRAANTLSSTPVRKQCASFMPL